MADSDGLSGEDWWRRLTPEETRALRQHGSVSVKNMPEGKLLRLVTE